VIPAQPDLEAWVWAAVKGIPGVTSFCYSALPMALVPWQVSYSMQVDCRARTKKAAWDRAEQVRRILWELPQVPWDEGWISYAQITEGPFWLADEDGQPRYVLRAEYRAHPNRTGDPSGPDARRVMVPG